ncbi:hypothetical protein GCM10009740_34790 [Terrabacter terrae]|uniref:Uncharacterized protein n=1 Tax=Terrabacter terrae TaxID=318434 RepID=A0ABN2URV7_9MICO
MGGLVEVAGPDGAGVCAGLADGVRAGEPVGGVLLEGLPWALVPAPRPACDVGVGVDPPVQPARTSVRPSPAARDEAHLIGRP